MQSSSMRQCITNRLHSLTIAANVRLSLAGFVTLSFRVLFSFQCLLRLRVARPSLYDIKEALRELESRSNSIDVEEDSTSESGEKPFV